MFNITQTKYYSLRENAFYFDYLRLLEEQILTSNYLAENQLSKNFNGTKGFSVVFRSSGINKVIQKFPYFKTYIDTALSSKYNAFYLNPLVLQGGGEVKAHVDCSITGYCQKKPAIIPKVVSVLYVKVPADLQGGELILRSLPRKNIEVGRVMPKVNTLLYFMGTLNHSVSKVTASGTRISLVCEQYELSEKQIQKIPEFAIRSAAYELAR